MPDLAPPILTPVIVYEDNHLVVLSKPAGLLSQGEITGEPNLVDWLRIHFGRHYVGLVHRLDRNTSGLMVVAKRSKSAERLTDALQKGDLKRRYLAWVLGTLPGEARWEHFLVKDGMTNLVRVVKNPTPGMKSAALQSRPIAQGFWQGQRLTLVEFELETGRSHQIRVQAAQEGFPLLGDRKYGAPHSGFERPALHSYKLSFPHPMSKELMEFEDSLPADMARILPAPSRAP